MKKTFFLTAALLLGSLAHSQEADDLGSKYAEVTFVARAEYSSVEDDHLGNSSFYALLDGAFSNKLSYSVATHLLSSDPKSLYTNTLYSDSTNWLDWAYMTYGFSNFEIEFGKNMMQWGTFEMQEYDFDSYFDIASSYWLNMPVYQWGATFRWVPSDTFFLGGQMTASPYGERPFSSGLFSYSLHCGTESCDWYNFLCSLNFLQVDRNEFMPLFNMGHKFITGNWEFVLDSTTEMYDGFRESAMVYANFTPSEKWKFTARAGYENMNTLFDMDCDRWFGGLLANWYPVESVRLHALAAYDSLLSSPTFNLGVTWQITL